MKAIMAKKATAILKYLLSPSATKDTIKRLKYWRSNPHIGDAILSATAMVRSGDILERLEGYGAMHLSLEKADVELNLLKRLNAVSLWTTILELGDATGDDKKAMIEAKVRAITMSD
jgi:hypothetical protein